MISSTTVERALIKQTYVRDAVNDTQTFASIVTSVKPPVYSETTGLSEKGPTQKAASSASKAVTASMSALSLSGMIKSAEHSQTACTERYARAIALLGYKT